MELDSRESFGQSSKEQPLYVNLILNSKLLAASDESSPEDKAHMKKREVNAKYDYLWMKFIGLAKSEASAPERLERFLIQINVSAL